MNTSGVKMTQLICKKMGSNSNRKEEPDLIVSRRTRSENGAYLELLSSDLF